MNANYPFIIVGGDSAFGGKVTLSRGIEGLTHHLNHWSRCRARKALSHGLSWPVNLLSHHWHTYLQNVLRRKWLWPFTISILIDLLWALQN